MVWRHNQLRERGWDVGVPMRVQAAACELLLFLLWALFVVRHNSYRSFETPPNQGLEAAVVRVLDAAACALQLPRS